MLTEIKCEPTTMKDTNTVTSEQVMVWAKSVEARQSQTAVLDSLKETKDLTL